MPDCPDCIAAGQRAKAHGFRDWRTEYACFEHAGVDLNGEWFLALLAERDRADEPEQQDLFGAAA